MKRIWIGAVISLLLLTGCSPRTDYRDTVSCSQLAKAALQGMGDAEQYLPADADHYDFYFGKDDAYDEVEDGYVVFHRETANVDELGIFRADDGEDVEEVRAMVERYLEGQVESLRSFAANYSPRDMEKIEGAGVRVYGRYVVYYILDGEDAERVLRTVERELSEGS